LEDDVYTVAFVLLDFLHSLLSPILPTNTLNSIVKLYEREGHTDPNVVQKVISELPKENAQTFVYLISFFREMLASSEKNKLTPEKICEIICECLIGEDKMSKSKNQFLQGDLQMRADTMVFQSRVFKNSSSNLTVKEKRRETQSGIRPSKESHQSMVVQMNSAGMRYTN